MAHSSASHDPPRKRRPPDVIRLALAFPVIACIALYSYYWFAQTVINPMPVQGVLREAVCHPASISRQGVKSGITELRTVYMFPSRSKDASYARSGPAVMDQITEYVEYDDASACEAEAIRREPGSMRTVWAGENPLSDRYRARLTEERHYPSATLLWVPGCIVAVLAWAWRRAKPRAA